MDILMFGGSGIISSEICRLAVEQKHTVTIFNRGRRKEEINPNANLVVGDFLKESVAQINGKLEPRYDVIIDFISRNPTQLKKSLEISKNRCEQFIFISSATVYNDKGGEKAYVESDAFGKSEWSYATLKADCEKYLNESDLPCKYTIIRPYVTYGHTRVPLQIAPIEYYTVINRIKLQKPIAVCEGNTKCTLTNASDFAVAACGLFLNPKSYGETFHITGDYVTTWAHVLECIAGAMNEKAQIIEIPKEFLREHRNEFGIDLDEVLEDKSRDMVFDNSKIKSAVPEFNNHRSFEQSLDSIMAYFGEPKYQIVNYFWDAGCDRMLEAYSKIVGVNIQHIDLDSFHGKLTKEQEKAYLSNRTKSALFFYKLNRKIKSLTTI